MSLCSLKNKNRSICDFHPDNDHVINFKLLNKYRMTHNIIFNFTEFEYTYITRPVAETLADTASKNPRILTLVGQFWRIRSHHLIINSPSKISIIIAKPLSNYFLLYKFAYLFVADGKSISDY